MNHEWCAGSLYCDVQLKAAGFNGEEIRSGSVLVVKTHKTSFTWTELTLPKCSEKVHTFLTQGPPRIIISISYYD